MTPTPEQTRKCANCMWWKDPIADLSAGLCIRWMDVTGPDQVCGSFRMKEPGQ